jgi:hypothetical protein
MQEGKRREAKAEVSSFPGVHGPKKQLEALAHYLENQSPGRVRAPPEDDGTHLCDANAGLGRQLRPESGRKCD